MPIDDLEAILAGHRARRAAFEAARAEHDAALLPLLRRYVAALFRERPGLNALALAAYQDYDSSQLTGRAYVSNHHLEDDAWNAAGFPAPCPSNEIDRDEAELLEDALMKFWPALQRQHGLGWCIAFWRDPEAEDGVASEQREHPGFD
jgi:hypothetical protein